jgi:streptogramin lyase
MLTQLTLVFLKQELQRLRLRFCVTLFLLPILITTSLKPVDAHGLQIITGAFSGPQGITVDRNGNMYLTDTGNNRIVKMAPNGTWLQIFNTSNPSLNEAAGVALDVSDNLYITDFYNCRIVKLAPNGTQLQIFNISDFLPSYPYGITLDIKQNIYVTDLYNRRILKFGPNGTQLAVFTASNPSFLNPRGVALDINNCIYVADSSNNRIVKFDSTGRQLQFFTTSAPFGLAVHASYDMYVGSGDIQNGSITKLGPDGTWLSNYTIGNSSVTVRGVALDSRSNIYATNYLNNQVSVIHFEECLMGYYCVNDASSAVLCPEGFYCPEQYIYGPQVIACIHPQQCPPGTITPILTFKASSSSSTAENSASSSISSSSTSSTSDNSLTSGISNGSTAVSDNSEGANSTDLELKILIGIIVPLTIVIIMIFLIGRYFFTRKKRNSQIEGDNRFESQVEGQWLELQNQSRRNSEKFKLHSHEIQTITVT